jgi:hypothetical protein
MARKRRDSVDLACEQWAKVKRVIMGLDEPKFAREYLGAVRSTLGARRDLHAGSTSTGRVVQHFPEVYVEEAALVNAAYWRMRPMLKALLEVHYVIRAPIDIKAQAMAMSPPTYYKHLDYAKGFIESELTR